MREVVAGDAANFFATESGLNAEANRDPLFGRLRLTDEGYDFVVLVALAETDPLPVSFGIVVESHSRFNSVTLVNPCRIGT